MSGSFTVGALAVAARGANAVGAVRLTLLPSKLEVELLRVGAFTDGYVPGGVTRFVRFAVPYSAVRGLVRRGDGVMLALDPAIATPHNRFFLTRFTDLPLESLIGMHKRRFLARSLAWLAPLPLAWLAVDRVPTDLVAGTLGRASLAAVVGASAAVTLTSFARWVSTGGPLSRQLRDSLEQRLAQRIGFEPAFFHETDPFEAPTEPSVAQPIVEPAPQPQVVVEAPPRIAAAPIEPAPLAEYEPELGPLRVISSGRPYALRGRKVRRPLPNVFTVAEPTMVRAPALRPQPAIARIPQLAAPAAIARQPVSWKDAPAPSPLPGRVAPFAPAPVPAHTPVAPPVVPAIGRAQPAFPPPPTPASASAGRVQPTLVDVSTPAEPEELPPIPLRSPRRRAYTTMAFAAAAIVLCLVGWRAVSSVRAPKPIALEVASDPVPMMKMPPALIEQVKAGQASPEPRNAEAAPEPPKKVSAWQACTCERNDSPLWRSGLPVLSLIPIPKVKDGVSAPSIAPTKDGEGASQYDFDIAVVNNSARSLHDVRVVVTFARRNSKGERVGATDRGLFWEGALKPARSVKWNVTGPGTELKIELAERRMLSRDLLPADAEGFARLLKATQPSVRVHAAMMLAYLADPRAIEASKTLSPVTEADKETLAQIGRAANPLRVCDVSFQKNAMEACVFNATDTLLQEPAVKEVTSTADRAGPGARVSRIGESLPAQSGLRVTLLGFGERADELELVDVAH